MSCTACQVPRQVPVTFDRPVRGAYGTSVSCTRQPASAARTGALQRARLTRAGLRVRDLPALRDVDTAQDALAVAAAAPRSRFAVQLAGFGS